MKRTCWTSVSDRFLVMAYADHSAHDIARVLNVPEQAVYRRANSLGLKKSTRFLKGHQSGRLDGRDRRGVGTRFKPGHTPWNKGKKHPGKGRSIDTQFQPGHRPATWRPIGSEVVSSDGYLRRKISDTGVQRRDWIGVHQIIWEEANGPLPENHVVTFINGDKADVRLENLTTLSRAELLYLNGRGFAELPADLRPAAIIAARLYCLTRRRESKPKGKRP